MLETIQDKFEEDISLMDCVIKCRYYSKKDKLYKKNDDLQKAF